MPEYPSPSRLVFAVSVGLRAKPRLPVRAGGVVTRHFAQQWKLRVLAQGVALKGIAKAALRRLLAYNKSSSYADLKVGESALFV